MRSSEYKKKSSKKLYQRILSFIFDLAPYVLLLLGLKFRRQLALFPYWRPVSIIVLVGFAWYFVWAFRVFRRRRHSFGKKNPKFYRHVFYRKWIPLFVVQIVVGFFGLTVTSCVVVFLVQKNIFAGLWWPTVIFLFALIAIVGSWLVYFTVVRIMEVGICRSGVFIVSDFYIWDSIKNISFDRNKKCITITCIPPENVSFVNGEPIAVPFDIKIKSASISGSLEKLYLLLREYQESRLKD